MASLDSDRHLRRDTASLATRRVLYREAKRQLTRLLRKRWRGTRAMLRSALKSLLRPRERGFLLRVIRDQAFALALASALATGAALKAAPAVELTDIEAGFGGFVMNGVAESDLAGRSVSGAGDVNGDGLADLIVGAPYADPDGKDGAGESYVVLGKADGAAVELSDVRAGIGGFVIKGVDDNDKAGASVSGAGDVNGDGLADLIVGECYYYCYAADIYVIFGKADGAAVELSDVREGVGGFVVKGVDKSSYYGHPVSGAGDVNGDGLADLIVGAPYADPDGKGNAGESYVVFGKADGAAVELADIRIGVGGFVLKGNAERDSAGESVSGAGDVNGDGLLDLIVGAPEADPDGKGNAGESYVVFGKADGAAVELADIRMGVGGFVLKGNAEQDSAGGSVSGAGDVNGDGLFDLIVGAPYADPDGKERAGESYVVFGKADGAAVELADVRVGTGGFVLKGLRFDRSGRRVSGAGDMNGDGLADVMVAASGASYVVFGKADGVPVDVFDVRMGLGGLEIRSAGDGRSDAISGAGDVNGDGVADLILGFSSAGLAGKSRAGKSYVVFGDLSPDTDADGLSDSLELFVARGSGCPDPRSADSDGDELSDGFERRLRDTDPCNVDTDGDDVSDKLDGVSIEPTGGVGGFLVRSVVEGDRAGTVVSGAGDVNGDGLADVMVAASGASYVVFGKADGVPVELSDVRAGVGGFVLKGTGRNISGAGDVNGDGLADLIVGAPSADPDGKDGAGESYVVVGKADGAAVDLSDVRAGIGGFVLKGIGSHDNAGDSVSGAGDVNGDGLHDVIVGAPGAGPAEAGESYVVFGKADGTAVELSDVRAGVGGFVLKGTKSYGRLGRSISGAGDVNGDGLADVIVGAPNADPSGRSYSGESYVVFGKADGAAVALSDLRAGVGGFVLKGVDNYDEAGSNVSGAGDVNGDGLDDVIVAAPGAGPAEARYSGESYVVFGKADGVAVELSDIRFGVGGFVLKGLDRDDRSGRSVSGAGDVNGDGLSDLIVGAPYANPDGKDDAGESYVVFGKADGVAVELSNIRFGVGGFVLKGLDRDDRSGRSVSGAGDVNGDGLDDVVVGAWLADPDGKGSAGESYVVFGFTPPDSDRDGLSDLAELELAGGSGCPDPDNPDSDDDDLSDSFEVRVSGTDPCNADTDGDGFEDNVDPTPLFADRDDDGLGDLEELGLAGGSGCPDPDNPDSDDDDLSDSFEVRVSGTDPCNADTDGDDLPDGIDTSPLDRDNDGLNDSEERELAGGSGCPDLDTLDSDGDQLADGFEVSTTRTDPCNADTDGDGLADNVDPAPLDASVLSHFEVRPFTFVKSESTESKLIVGLGGLGISRISMEPAELGPWFRSGETIELTDNGLPPDEHAGDGLFTGYLELTDPPAESFIGRHIGHVSMNVEFPDGQSARVEAAPVGRVAVIDEDRRLPITRVSPSVFASDYVVNLVHPESITRQPLLLARGYDLPLASRAFYTHFPDGFDWLVYFNIYPRRGSSGGLSYRRVRNSIKGIGELLGHSSGSYGSDGVLRGVINVDVFSPLVHQQFLTHEIFHTWGVGQGFWNLGLRDNRSLSHWGAIATGGQASLFGGGWTLVSITDLGDGEFCGERDTTSSRELPMDLELYMMGLVPSSAIGTYPYIIDGELLERSSSCGGARYRGSGIGLLNEELILGEFGERDPPYPDSNRFRAAVVVVSDRPLESAEWDYVSRVFEAHETRFESDLGGLATLSYRVEPLGDSRPFLRGDANSDGRRNLLDARTLLDFVFVGTAAPACQKALDLDDDGEIRINDPVYLLNFFFRRGPKPREPFPECGRDPTRDALSCESFPACG